MAAAPPEIHPSAARGETSILLLLYAMVAPPCAWIMAQVFCSALVTEACHPKYDPLPAPEFDGTHLAHALALGVAVLVCASGAVVAQGAWRRTRAEHLGGSQTLLAVGEGRSRFMALVGLLTSLGFLLAVLFSAPADLLVPLC